MAAKFGLARVLPRLAPAGAAGTGKKGE